MRKGEKLYANIKSALLVSLIILSSYLYVPMAVSGFSLQTVFINLTALMLSPWQGFFTVLLWLLMGAVGLPVFSGGGGIGKLFGITGGFYWGFLVAVPVMTRLKGDRISFVRYFLSLSVGLLIEHAFAVAVMSFHNQGDIIASFMSVSLPFIAGDILKCAVSSLAAVKINRVIK